MDFAPSPQTTDDLAKLRRFMEERIIPNEEAYVAANRTVNAGADWRLWQVAPLMAELRGEARRLGLWNLFLSRSTLDYAPLAEEMGRSLIASEVFNCHAPDSGNMEVLHQQGSDGQKARWLTPLLNGEIRSVFCMTEPDAASSDPSNLKATVRVDKDAVVLDGRKWWSTGIGHPHARLLLFLGVSDPQAGRHDRHSLVLVPIDAPGVKVERMLPSFGEFDPPHGHGEVSFTNVRVPLDHVVSGLGRGYHIAQGRLGPGRIHHCMRAIGAAERALELLTRRGLSRTAFGKPLVMLGGNLERIADLRVAIDQARLLTLHAAWKVDRIGGAKAMAEISAIKMVVPTVLQRVVDEAIQMFGGAGLSHDTPLTALFTLARALRIVDGPDAVHRGVVARLELAKYQTERPRGEP